MRLAVVGVDRHRSLTGLQEVMRWAAGAAERAAAGLRTGEALTLFTAPRLPKRKRKLAYAYAYSREVRKRNTVHTSTLL